jgi:outer membrane protein assembly factor BamB
MRTLLCLTIILSSLATAQTPVKLWEFDTKDASFGQTAAGDIDGDGRLELVFGCYRNDGHIYALNAEDGSLLWKVDAARPGAQGCNDVAPAIVDTDGDGTLEVIVPSSCNPVTYCIDGATGDIRWSASTRGSDSPPSIADIDDDGDLEILHGEFGGWVRCLDARSGDMEWELAVDTHSWIQTAPTLLDADGDGGMDFVVATWNRTEGDTNTIRCYRCSDRFLLWSRPLQDVVYHGSAVADLDEDGKPELTIGDYSGTLHVLNAENGSVSWTMPPRGTGHYIGAPVSAGDLDGDGVCELLVVSWYQVLALSAEGDLRWRYDIPGFHTAFRGAALADVDGDALPDAVFGTSGGLLVALRGTDGHALWSVDLAAEYGDARFGLDHAPVIADFDGDGELDIFIVGGHGEYPDIENGFGRAYAYSIGRGEGPPWLMFQQNLHRSSSIFPARTTGVSIDHPAPTVSSLQIYPQPARDILYVTEAESPRLRIFDALGRCVKLSTASEAQRGVDIRALPPGLYHIITSSGSQSTFLKY